MLKRPFVLTKPRLHYAIGMEIEQDLQQGLSLQDNENASSDKGEVSYEMFKIND